MVFTTGMVTSLLLLREKGDEMNIENECQLIVEHADRLMRMAQIFKAQNEEHINRVIELTKRAEFAEAIVGKLAARVEGAEALIERLVREVALFRFHGGVVDVDKLDALIVEGRANKKESVE